MPFVIVVIFVVQVFGNRNAISSPGNPGPLIETTMYCWPPTWNEIGHLAAIAGIRTFLSYFLDKEVENTRRLQLDQGTERAA